MIQIWNSMWPAMNRAVRENLLLIASSTVIIGKIVGKGKLRIPTTVVLKER